MFAVLFSVIMEMAPATAVQSNQHFFLAPPNKKLNINIKAIKTHDFSILKVLTLGERR